MHVFTDARWAANFRGGAPIAIRRRGKTQGGTARVVDDPADAARRIRGILTEKKPRALALAIDKDHVPSDADLNAARTVILIDVEA